MLSEMLCYLSVQDIQHMLIKLIKFNIQTPVTVLGVHISHRHDRVAVFLQPQNLRSPCLAQINKSSGYLQTPVLHNRPWFWFIVPSLACQA